MVLEARPDPTKVRGGVCIKLTTFFPLRTALSWEPYTGGDAWQYGGKSAECPNAQAISQETRP
jgi:hypothetical protein